MFILFSSHIGYARKTGCSRDEAMLTEDIVPIRNAKVGDDPTVGGDTRVTIWNEPGATPRKPEGPIVCLAFQAIAAWRVVQCKF